MKEQPDIDLTPEELEELMRDLPRILRELNIEVAGEGLA